MRPASINWFSDLEGEAIPTLASILSHIPESHTGRAPVGTARAAIYNG
jgi:hypothetical protein